MSVLHTVYIVIGLLAFVLNILVVFRNHLPAQVYNIATFGLGMLPIKGAEDPTTKLPQLVPKRLASYLLVCHQLARSLSTVYRVSV